MGFLSKAKKNLSEGLRKASEERVKVVDSIKSDDEPDKEKKEKKKPVKRKPKEKPQDDKKKEEKTEQEKDSLTDDNIFQNDFDIPQDSNFHFDDDDDLPVYSNPKEPTKKDSVSEEDNEKLKDILELLKIPSTYVIASDVLMPDDFKNVSFDIQVPQGYDVGQVEFFVELAESSIKEYLKLLEERNDHIAKLATTVDRLQVDLENQKFESQIAEGIGIIPTSDNDELEKQNNQLRVEIKQLEDRLKSKEKKPDLSSEERELYENLRNQYSILEREVKILQQNNNDLKIELARYDEEADDTDWMAGAQANAENDVYGKTPFIGPGGSIEYMDELPRNDNTKKEDIILPSLDLIEEEKTSGDDNVLPEVDDNRKDEQDNNDSSFEKNVIEDEDSDNEDDELSKLMGEWS